MASGKRCKDNSEQSGLVSGCATGFWRVGNAVDFTLSACLTTRERKRVYIRNEESKPSAQDAFIELETARVATQKSLRFHFRVAPQVSSAGEKPYKVRVTHTRLNPTGA